MSLDDIHMSTQDLLEKQQLDAGGCGTISLCFHRKHGYVVLKTVYTGPQRTEYNASLLEEGRIMRKLQHDRVVKLLGIVLEDGNYSLVMEYVDRGNMMKVLQKLSIPLSVKGRFVLEIIEGMLYLHEQGLVHKDLKPENILVDADFHIKIADLGVACFKNWSRLTKEETTRQKKIKSASQNNAGTLFYMAPEHLRSVNVKPDEKSDIYSFGIVMWAIFANKEPYEHGINEAQICFGIMNGNRPDIEEIIEKCPMEIIDLMKQCWDQEAEKRPTFAEISKTYKPFYYQNIGKNIEEDLKKIKKVWPEPNELLQRMQSLQIDAVAEDPSNGQIDQPNSLHSSQGPVTSEVNEAQFAASSENQPVESCETSFTAPDNLERKLQREYNYHIHGSWMDKPGVAGVPHVVYTPEMREEERRRRVSHDPFAKMFSAPQQSELYPRAENTTSNTNPYFWPQAPATPARGNFDIFYGPNPKNLLPGNPEDLYEPPSAGTFSLSKTPVPESGTSLHSQTNINRYPKTADTDTGNDSTSFSRGTFAYYPPVPQLPRDDAETQVEPPQADASSQTDLPSTEGAAQDLGSREQQDLEAPRGPEGRGGCQGYMRAQLGELLKQTALLLEKLIRQRSIQESHRESDELHYTQRVSVQQQHLEAGQGEEDSIKYSISNSSGIQIGSNNYMKIEEQNQHISTSPVTTEASYSYFESRGIFDNTTVLTDNHLNLVREKLARQWKHCARKLGFSDPEIDEIDHDYERDGLKEKVYQMLLKWGMREGSKGATVGKLAKALFGCQRLDLLTSLMQMNEE